MTDSDGSVAQLGEQRTCNAKVEGSIPSCIHHLGVPSLRLAREHESVMGLDPTIFTAGGEVRSRGGSYPLETECDSPA